MRRNSGQLRASFFIIVVKCGISHNLFGTCISNGILRILTLMSSSPQSKVSKTMVLILTRSASAKHFFSDAGGKVCLTKIMTSFLNLRIVIKQRHLWFSDATYSQDTNTGWNLWIVSPVMVCA